MPRGERAEQCIRRSAPERPEAEVGSTPRWGRGSPKAPNPCPVGWSPKHRPGVAPLSRGWSS
eukprot:13892302-Alexandrium_andersonii.AAC.1